MLGVEVGYEVGALVFGGEGDHFLGELEVGGVLFGALPASEHFQAAVFSVVAFDGGEDASVEAGEFEAEVDDFGDEFVEAGEGPEEADDLVKLFEGAIFVDDLVEFLGRNGAATFDLQRLVKGKGGLIEGVEFFVGFESGHSAGFPSGDGAHVGA